ncbi:MAG: NADH:ubiquinone reductase (Na(+)-transporting) subunit B [Desulfotalea sp.]
MDKFFKKLGKHFEEGGAFTRYYPLYEAFDSFLFGSRLKTSTAPHIRDGIDFKRIMTIVILALVPCVVIGIWNTGYQANVQLSALGQTEIEGWRGFFLSYLGTDQSSFLANLGHGCLYFLPIYIVTILAGSFWEAVFNLVRGHEFSEAFLVTSLLYSLILPPTIPLWQVALGISFGVIFAKEVFGGVGRNFMNPALAGRAFLFFAYPAQITGDSVWIAVDGVSSATPLAQIASGALSVGDLSYTWADAFWGTIPGCIGETSVIACLFGAFVLLVTRIASWRVMSSMTFGAILASSLLYFFAGDSNPMQSVPPHFHLVLGGFAFGMVFMATDPVSAAHTKTGQLLYGFFVGVMVIMIRVQNPAYAEGVMLAILLGNVFAPLFDYVVIRANIKRRRLRNA